MKLILEGMTVADLAAEAKQFLSGLEGSQRHPERPTTAEPEPPLPETPPPDLVAEAQRVFEQDVCPVHKQPWKTVPAGVSKKTGKPYESFKACPATGCNERPRRAA